MGLLNQRESMVKKTRAYRMDGQGYEGHTKDMKPGVKDTRPSRLQANRHRYYMKHKNSAGKSNAEDAVRVEREEDKPWPGSSMLECCHPALDGSLPQLRDCLELWVHWHEKNAKIPFGDLDNFCNDCLPEYQRQERAAHRCSRPDVVFNTLKFDHEPSDDYAEYKEWLDDGVRGVRPALRVVHVPVPFEDRPAKAYLDHVKDASGKVSLGKRRAAIRRAAGGV